MKRSEILKGSAELAVLSLLKKNDMYGYEITKKLKSTKESVLAIGEGTLYPMLHRLEQRGFIKGRWELVKGRRKVLYYGLTKKGKDELAERKLYWDLMTGAVNKILKSSS
ncbi:MAG: helix-turn-helix transcriptional regulator [Candidatus Lindowbacteria bacterium]|nr:helix-turn-helix transcriptional regulator [Candidatus Lindowbacteria bacterium]